MRKMIFVGTLHANMTPKKELAEILKSYKPDQLLVEIQQKDLEKRNLANYPDEMVFAADWGKRNGIPVYGFDSPISELAEGKTEEDNEELIKNTEQIVLRHNWKDFNKDKYQELLSTPEEEELIDDAKALQREQEMLKNILENAADKGVVIILTGSYHLKFFEKELPKALFPFR